MIQHFISQSFTPKLYTILQQGYSVNECKSDLISGLIVAIVALPLSMALAIASGASPYQGLITAVIAGFLISLLGGSRVQIGGPTGAFVVVVYNVIIQHGYDGLILATVLAGIILIIMGYAKLGQIVKFLPNSVITGFTSGIAVIIASSQIKDFFGLDIGEVPADFISKWQLYITNWQMVDIQAALVGSVALGVIVILRKYAPKWPGYLIAIGFSVLIVSYFNLHIETIGMRFPNIPAGLPSLHLPDFSFAKLKEMVPSAFVIAFLAGIEALLSAVVADGMTGFKHRSNQELVGQGVANIASALFGGLPATGAIARTATNIKSGGTTPMAGIFHSLFLLLFILYFMDFVSYIPMTVLAAILFVVSWGMSEVDNFVYIVKFSSTERLVLILTFLLTIFVDLTLAIGVGVTLSSIIFAYNMSQTVHIYHQKHQLSDKTDLAELRKDLPAGVEVFQINGPLFFGVGSELIDALKSMGQTPKVLILQMELVPYLDITARKVLSSFIQRSLNSHIKIILCSVQKQPLEILLNHEVSDNKTEVFFKENFLLAVEFAQEIISGKTT